MKAQDKEGGREAAITIERQGGLDERQIDTFTRLASDYSVE